jgi:hypothetical protein
VTLNRAHPVDLSCDCAVLFVRGRGVLKHRRGPLTNDAGRSDRMADLMKAQVCLGVTVIATGALAS